MKISTGTIVLNAASILPQGMFWAQLEHLYSFSDEIFITEGATQASDHYWDGDTSWLTSDGHSTDETINIIKSFPDPQNKITLIQRDGFWNGKTEMCNEWSKRATGNYLWQVDADEFYLREDILKIKNLLNSESPDAVHFYANHFWGGWKSCIDEKGLGWGNNLPWMRIFKHDPGSKWKSHEPPEYILADGKSCNDGKVASRDHTLKLGIKMFHYSYVCQSQIDFKTRFFKNNSYPEMWGNWKKDNSYPLINGDKTVEYLGRHPESIQKIIDYEYA